MNFQHAICYPQQTHNVIMPYQHHIMLIQHCYDLVCLLGCLLILVFFFLRLYRAFISKVCRWRKQEKGAVPAKIVVRSDGCKFRWVQQFFLLSPSVYKNYNPSVACSYKTNTLVKKLFRKLFCPRKKENCFVKFDTTIL